MCRGVHRTALNLRWAVHFRVPDDVGPGHVYGSTDHLPERPVSRVFSTVIPRQALEFPDIDPSSAARQSWEYVGRVLGFSHDARTGQVVENTPGHSRWLRIRSASCAPFSGSSCVVANGQAKPLPSSCFGMMWK